MHIEIYVCDNRTFTTEIVVRSNKVKIKTNGKQSTETNQNLSNLNFMFIFFTIM